MTKELQEKVTQLLADAAEVGKLDAGFLTSNSGVAYCAGLMVGMSARAKGILKELKEAEAEMGDY